MMPRRRSTAGVLPCSQLSSCWPGAATRNRCRWPTVPTLPPPTPVGMEQMPPEPPLPPGRPESRTATRPPACAPSPTKAEADAAVADIRARGRLIVGLDIGSNLFSFRDPITGEITGFDVDIAGEIARDIFGAPSHVEYRILSSEERITALQNAEVDIVVKTMTITCERRKLVNFSTVYLDAQSAHPRPARLDDQPSRPTCPASGCAWRGAPRRCIG